MSADENYRRRLNSGQDAQAAALLAIADGLDELIALFQGRAADQGGTDETN